MSSSSIVWRIAEAKQRFSEVVQAALSEPQQIYNRSKLVAFVVDAELFQEFLAWKAQRNRRTLSIAFEELRTLCETEDYVLEMPERCDRENPFLTGDFD